jgi:hypothetical protein
MNILRGDDMDKEKTEKLLLSIEEKINILDRKITGGLTIDDDIEDLRCNFKSLKILLK